MTCIATNTPIINLGGKIVWADINHKTGSINPYEVEKKLLALPKQYLLLIGAEPLVNLIN